MCDTVCCVHGCTCAPKAVRVRLKLCVHTCIKSCMHACMHDFIQVCVQLDVVHGCMHGACMRVCVFMIACASQIHDVLVNDMVPVGILVTEHFDNR